MNRGEKAGHQNLVSAIQRSSTLTLHFELLVNKLLGRSANKDWLYLYYDHKKSE